MYLLKNDFSRLTNPKRISSKKEKKEKARLLFHMYTQVDGMLVHHRVTPQHYFAVTHFYTWVERGTSSVKCLALQEQNTVTKARA